MKKCRDYRMDILEGKDSQELRRHLAECPGCADARNAWEAMKNASVLPEVPELLTSNIRNYAASALRGKRRRFRLKYIWMPAAAALFICFGIAYTALPGIPQAKVTAPVNLTETYSGMDMLDSDLLALTSQLEQTSDKLLSMTVLSSIMETAQKNGGGI